MKVAVVNPIAKLQVVAASTVAPPVSVLAAAMAFLFLGKESA